MHNSSADSQPGTPQQRTATARTRTIAGASLGAIVALAIAACGGQGSRAHSAAGNSRPPAGNAHVAAAQPVQAVDYLSVAPGVKPGSDGHLHDAYSQTTFYVHSGRPVKLVIHNADDVAHSIVSPAAGVDIRVRPGTHTYRLMIKHRGTFQWHCAMPCDPFSMAHSGYMRGTLVAE